MTDEDTMVCALLHDVIEDTDNTIDDLKAMVFSTEITDVLSLLTHDKAVPYMEYVEKTKAIRSSWQSNWLICDITAIQPDLK